MTIRIPNSKAIAYEIEGREWEASTLQHPYPGCLRVRLVNESSWRKIMRLVRVAEAIQRSEGDAMDIDLAEAIDAFRKDQK